MTMQTSDILIQARALIADPAHWMQEDWHGLNNAGEPCYCGLGAIAKVTQATWQSDILETLAAQLLRDTVPSQFFTDNGYGDGATFAPYNDASTHDEVLAAFDKAIAVAVEQEAS